MIFLEFAVGVLTMHAVGDLTDRELVRRRIVPVCLIIEIHKCACKLQRHPMPLSLYVAFL